MLIESESVDPKLGVQTATGTIAPEVELLEVMIPVEEVGILIPVEEVEPVETTDPVLVIRGAVHFPS